VQHDRAIIRENAGIDHFVQSRRTVIQMVNPIFKKIATMAPYDKARKLAPGLRLLAEGETARHTGLGVRNNLRPQSLAAMFEYLLTTDWMRHVCCAIVYLSEHAKHRYGRSIERIKFRECRYS